MVAKSVIVESLERCLSRFSPEADFSFEESADINCLAEHIVDHLAEVEYITLTDEAEPTDPDALPE